MRPDEGIDIARGRRVIRSRRRKKGRRVLAIAPRVRMDARSLLVGLIENRREIDGTSETGPLAAVVAADVAAVLHDQFRARGDAVGRIVRDERSVAVAGGDTRGERAVTRVVVRGRIARIVAAEGAGILIAENRRR